MTLAYFGIESSGLNLAIDLLILFAVVLYFALIYWTYADARRRIYDPMLVGCATFLSLFPFVGTIVYMVLRPPDLDHGLCPHCDYRVERDFIRCPSCLRKLKERCVSCSRPLDQAWTICPYCETEVAAAAAPTRRTRRRRTAADSERPEIGVPAGEKDRSAVQAPDDWLGETAGEGTAVLAEDGEDAAAVANPVAAAKPATRSRSTGRASRPRSPS